MNTKSKERDQRGGKGSGMADREEGKEEGEEEGADTDEKNKTAAPTKRTETEQQN